MEATIHSNSYENKNNMSTNKAIKDLQSKWNRLSLSDKQKEFNYLTKSINYSKTSKAKSNKSYLVKERISQQKSGDLVQYLDDSQNALVSLKAELGWESLK